MADMRSRFMTLGIINAAEVDDDDNEEDEDLRRALAASVAEQPPRARVDGAQAHEDAELNAALLASLERQPSVDAAGRDDIAQAIAESLTLSTLDQYSQQEAVAASLSLTTLDPYSQQEALLRQFNQARPPSPPRPVVEWEEEEQLRRALEASLRDASSTPPPMAPHASLSQIPLTAFVAPPAASSSSAVPAVPDPNPWGSDPPFDADERGAEHLHAQWESDPPLDADEREARRLQALFDAEQREAEHLHAQRREAEQREANALAVRFQQEELMRLREVERVRAEALESERRAEHVRKLARQAEEAAQRRGEHLHARLAEEAAIKEAAQRAEAAQRRDEHLHAQRAEAAAARELDEAAVQRRGEHLHAQRRGELDEAAELRRQVQVREEAEAARTARAAAAAAIKAEAAAVAATRAAKAREALELQAQIAEERRRGEHLHAALELQAQIAEERRQHAGAHHGVDERRQHVQLYGKGSPGPSTLPRPESTLPSAGPSTLPMTTMAFDWSAVAPAPSATAAPGGAGIGRGARGGSLSGGSHGGGGGGRGFGRGAVGMQVLTTAPRLGFGRGAVGGTGAAETTISDEVLARSLHQEEVQRISGHRAGAHPAAAAATAATPVVCERAPAGPALPSKRTIVVVIDGMNVGRNRSTVDPEYEDLTSPKRIAFDEVRARAGDRSPPLLALGVIAAIAAVLKANDSKEARAAGVEYLPMAFLVEWVRDGGRTGALKAFNAERLDAWQHYITFTPPRRDDDDAQIVWAKLQLRLGHECYVVTNDNWDDHRRSGKITHEWFAQHVVPYMWIGRSGALQLTPPDGVRLPGLCDVDD